MLTSMWVDRDQELSQAARYQKGARNKACCLLMILAIVLTIVLLAVSFQTPTRTER